MITTHRVVPPSSILTRGKTGTWAVGRLEETRPAYQVEILTPGSPSARVLLDKKELDASNEGGDQTPLAEPILRPTRFSAGGVAVIGAALARLERQKASGSLHPRTQHAALRAPRS